jgi:hypothetical protein
MPLIRFFRSDEGYELSGSTQFNLDAQPICQGDGQFSSGQLCVPKVCSKSCKNPSSPSSSSWSSSSSSSSSSSLPYNPCTKSWGLCFALFNPQILHSFTFPTKSIDSFNSHLHVSSDFSDRQHATRVNTESSPLIARTDLPSPIHGSRKL